MAAPVLKKGRSGPVETGQTITQSDRDAVTVVVEGSYGNLKALPDNRIVSFVPAGYTFESSQLTSGDHGMGRLEVHAVKYDAPGDNNLAPVRTTFRIEMQEVQYDLEDHPHLADARDTILKWLATDETVRVDGNDYYWQDPNGNKHQIGGAAAGALALKFISAYMAGIKSFVRYYPVISKISVWKNPPGLAMSGRSYTSGTPRFSSGIGGYDDPPISLNGYPSRHWFKSGDGWEQNENRTWTRQEQWTYTPEASNAQDGHAWIYSELGGGS